MNYITNKQQYVIICKVHYSFLFLPKLCFRRTLATYYENNSNVKIEDSYAVMIRNNSKHIKTSNK